MANLSHSIVDNLPNLSGCESIIREAIKNRPKTVFLSDSPLDFRKIRSSCAIALHMHQPLIPAGNNNLETAEVISNLKRMWDNPNEGDNHNAPVFRDCYKRMGDFIPKLIDEGKEPRAMLEYSGTLLYGLEAMGQQEVLENLKRITVDKRYRRAVEWLGCPWGHAVAPSTPVQDFRLHVEAWQHHFASIFGLEALSRVRGFSPSEMALPNHPDVAYEFVRTLKDCGYEWVIVQEHTIEIPAGDTTLFVPHIPHRLVCRNSKGEEASIVAIIKTQGSDTKLVGQMQPYYEAKGISRFQLGNFQREIPQIVTQIADGENGGVMMNDFPPKFMQVVEESSGTETPLINATEYLEHLYSMGISESDFPVIQPIMQNRIWANFKAGEGPEKLEATITELKKADDRFHVDGGSWTNNISWVQGYDNLLGPMEKASSLFFEKAIKPQVSTSDPRYRNALFNLLCSQTSCFRYWGQGQWTDFGRELCRRASKILIESF